MPVTFEYDTSNRLVSTRFFGVLSDDDLRHAKAKEYELFEPGSDQLQIIDARDVTDVQVTGQGVRELAADTPYGPGSRRALVATSDAMFGMSRMFEMLRDRDGDVFRVFRSMKEATDWLGLDSGPD